MAERVVAEDGKRLVSDLRVRIFDQELHDAWYDLGNTHLVTSASFAGKSVERDFANNSDGVGQCAQEHRRGPVSGMVVEQVEASASDPRVLVREGGLLQCRDGDSSRSAQESAAALLR